MNNLVRWCALVSLTLLLQCICCTQGASISALGTTINELPWMVRWPGFGCTVAKRYWINL